MSTFAHGSLPPVKFLTDENIRRFLAAQWSYKHNKSTVTSAKAYVSWTLKENGLPPFVHANAGLYKLSWNFFKSLKKDPRWRNYTPNAAESLTEDEAKKVA